MSIFPWTYKPLHATSAEVAAAPPPAPTVPVSSVVQRRAAAVQPVSSDSTQGEVPQTNMFSFKSIGHFFAVTLVHDFQVAAAWLQKEKPVIDTAVQTAAGVVSIVNPTAATVAQAIARASESITGDALALVNNADAATKAKGLSLPLDTATIQGIEQILRDAEAVKKGSTVAPAGLPVVAPAAPIVAATPVAG